MEDFNIPLAISDDKKVEILLKALEERYSATKIIRERVQNICIWVLGLFVSASGYLLTSTNCISIHQKLLFTCITIFSIIIVRLLYLRDLELGCKPQQQIQAKIETVLGLCKKGVFAVDSIYPDTWTHAGTKKGKGNFFLHNYILIYTGTVILLVSLWVK